MRSAFGSIVPFRDGYRVWWQQGGRRRSHFIHGSRADAALYLAKIQASLQGISASATWGEYWLCVVEPSFDELEVKTREEYERLWRRELEFALAPRRIEDTTPRQLEALLAKMSPGVGVAAGRLLRKIGNMAIRDGIVMRNPMFGVKVKPPKPKPKALLTAEDVAPFLEAIRGLKYEPVLLCELGGGLRHEEACALRWEDITEWEYRGTVYAAVTVSKALVSTNTGICLKDTKTAFSGRCVPLGEPFASRLLTIKAEHGADGVILARYERGNVYASPATMTHNWRSWCERHQVRYIPPKNLRSTFATLHGEAGSPDSLVSGALGHSDGTTRGKHYQAITLKGLAFIADNLTEYLESHKDSTHFAT